MATTILYTTVEAIRATLGTDGFDIEDQMLVDYDLESAMLIRLAEILPTHEAVADTEEGEFRIKQWCQYFGALTFLETAQASIAKKYAANQDTLERFNVDFEAIITRLKLRVTRLENVMNPVGTTPTKYSLIGVSKPEFDPVTGPTT